MNTIATKYKSLTQLNGKNLSYCEPSVKNLMHTRASSFLKELAKHLELTSVKVSSNKAGIAVSGEVTLISDQLYVMIDSAPYNNPDHELQAMFRGVLHNRDYSGLHNMFEPIQRMRLDALIRGCKVAMVESKKAQEAAKETAHA